MLRHCNFVILFFAKLLIQKETQAFCGVNDTKGINGFWDFKDIKEFREFRDFDGLKDFNDPNGLKALIPSKPKGVLSGCGKGFIGSRKGSYRKPEAFLSRRGRSGMALGCRRKKKMPGRFTSRQ